MGHTPIRTLETSEGQLEEVSSRVSGCQPRQSSYTGGGEGENSQAALTSDGSCHTEGDEQRLAQSARLSHHASHQSGQTLLGQHLTEDRTESPSSGAVTEMSDDHHFVF